MLELSEQDNIDFKYVQGNKIMMIRGLSGHHVLLTVVVGSNLGQDFAKTAPVYKNRLKSAIRMLVKVCVIEYVYILT